MISFTVAGVIGRDELVGSESPAGRGKRIVDQIQRIPDAGCGAKNCRIESAVAVVITASRDVSVRAKRDERDVAAGIVQASAIKEKALLAGCSSGSIDRRVRLSIAVVVSDYRRIIPVLSERLEPEGVV